MKKLTCAILPFVLVAIAAAPASANHSWGGYHWARTSNPFTVKLVDNLSTASWKAHLAAASSHPTENDWSDASVMDTTVVSGSPNKRCAMRAGTVQVCNSKYGNNGWLGLATIYLTGGTHITQASAKMNDTYFNTSYYNNPNEKLHVMCQEVGHGFGLGHTSEDGSSQNTCMDYFSNTGVNATSTTSTRPHQHDYDTLAGIYSHTNDGLTTLASAASTSPGMAGRADAKPYRTTRHDHGRHTEIVEDFADGSTRITDVIWAGVPRASVDRG